MYNEENIEKRKYIPKITSRARLKQDLLTFVLGSDRMWAELMTIFTLTKSVPYYFMSYFFIVFEESHNKYLSDKRRFQAHLSK